MKAIRSALWLVPVLALSAWVGGAHAAEVKGKLLLRPYKPSDESPPGYRPYNWETGNGFKETERVPVGPRELAVVLRGKTAGNAEPVEVRLQGGGLSPATIVARPGAAVAFSNHDEIAHELYAEGLDGFSPEAIAPRGKRSIALREAGSWPLRDNLVPHLKGQLHVMADLVACADLAGNGQFVFKDVAPGNYTLEVLHGPDTVATRKVTVGDRGLTIDAVALTAAQKTK